MARLGAGDGLGPGGRAADPAAAGRGTPRQAESWQAVDDLYLQSDIGSVYEAYGDTCGNKYVAGTMDYCVDVMP